jgi:hypothetical protein
MTYAFSDGSPFAELGVFLLTFLIGLAIFQVGGLARALDRGMTATAGFVRRRIFTVDDPDIEQRRLDLLRILLGLMILLRNYGNLLTATQLDNIATTAAVATATVLSFFILIGFAVPVTAFVLCLLLNSILDNVAQTSSLSSIIVSMSLIPFALAPAGRSLSVDALIMRSDGPIGRFWRAAYDWWGPLTLDRAALAKFALLLAYGAISLSSGLLHLQFEVWRKGLTNSWMFINPVANPHFHDLALGVYAFSPSIYLFLTKLSAYGTLVFQLGFVPLLLVNRWTKYSVIILEFGFVIGSVTLLALKWLGWVQLALCGILFWNRWKLNVGGKERVSILYNDRNDSTYGLRRMLAAVDLFKIVEFLPLSQRIDGPRANGPSISDAATELHGVDAAGRVSSGYDLYLLVAGRILLLLPLWPILWVGKITRLGPVLLARLSKPASPAFAPSISLSAIPRASHVSAVKPKAFNAIFRSFVLTFMIMFAAYSARLPVIPFLPGMAPVAAASKNIFGQAPLAVGLFQINAFNFPPLSGPIVTGEMTWKKTGSTDWQQVMWLPPTRSEIFVSDILFYQSIIAFNMQRENGFCFSKDAITTLINRPGLRAVFNQSRFADGEFKLRLVAFQIPSLADFEARRFVGLDWKDVCEATIPAQAPSQMSFNYFEGGIRSVAHRSPLTFPVSMAGIPALMNYPCKAEAARVAYWFDRGHLPERASTALPLVQALMQQTNETSPPVCLAAALKVYDALDVDWRERNLPAPGGTCEVDLAAARAFADVIAGPANVSAAKQRLRDAEAANKSGNQAACLIATSEVRRIYYNSIRQN